MDWFSQVIGVLKLFVSTRIIIGILITSGFLLFFGKYFPFLDEIIYNNKAIIFIIFIFTAAILIVAIATSIINPILKIIKSYNVKRWLMKRYIKALNDSEKAILREFFLQGKDEIILPVNNPNVVKLIEKGILSSTGAYIKHLPIGTTMYVEISYEARELIDLKLIGWPEGMPKRPKQKEFNNILKNRPQFINVIKAEKAERNPFDEWFK